MEFNKILHEASIPRGDVHILKVLQLHLFYRVMALLLVGRKPFYLLSCWSVRSHILSSLFLTNHRVEFNNILHEASIPRGDVHILKVLQLQVILQSYGPFVGWSEAIF